MLLFTRHKILPLLVLSSLIIFLVPVSCNNYYFRHTQKVGGIHHFNMLHVGGVKQAVWIKGSNSNNPIILYLHGGPGFPLMPFEPFEETFKEMERSFTMVYWEQRGTGKSFNLNIPGKSMNLDQFVEDAQKVSEYVLALLGQEKLFLWGHSWGSGVAVLFANKYPELIHALITTGQSVNPFLNEREGYRFVLEKALRDNKRRAIRQLQWIDTIPENYTLQDALTIRRWVYHYGGIVKNRQKERPYVDFKEIYDILSAPEYSLGERVNIALFPLFSANMLWDDMKHLNLNKDAPRLDVPVYFLLGRYDVIVSSELAAEYFYNLEAPAGKSLVWFEHSAHRPYAEERGKFMNVLNKIRDAHADSLHF